MGVHASPQEVVAWAHYDNVAIAWAAPRLHAGISARSVYLHIVLTADRGSYSPMRLMAAVGR